MAHNGLQLASSRSTSTRNWPTACHNITQLAYSWPRQPHSWPTAGPQLGQSRLVLHCLAVHGFVMTCIGGYWLGSSCRACLASSCDAMTCIARSWNGWHCIVLHEGQAGNPPKVGAMRFPHACVRARVRARVRACVLACVRVRAREGAWSAFVVVCSCAYSCLGLCVL